MMETKKLRQADFVTSILLILFGAWVLFEAFKMPMKGTYGGVKNAWYVSPALLPLIIGFFVIVLGIVLLMLAIRTGGAADFLEKLKSFRPARNEGIERFAAILLAFGSLVYLLIPRVDFFLSVWFFLIYMITVFYFDDVSLLRKLTLLFFLENALLLLLYIFGLAPLLNSLFRYMTDVVVLVEIILFHVYGSVLSRSSEELRKKYKLSVRIAVIVPFLLAPVFRYALLVPLPTEGGIIDLMSLVYYSLR